MPRRCALSELFSEKLVFFKRGSRRTFPLFIRTYAGLRQASEKLKSLSARKIRVVTRDSEAAKKSRTGLWEIQDNLTMPT